STGGIDAAETPGSHHRTQEQTPADLISTVDHSQQGTGDSCTYTPRCLIPFGINFGYFWLFEGWKRPISSKLGLSVAGGGLGWMNPRKNLVVIGLTGVQRSITEVHSTADPANVSRIMAQSAARVARQFNPEELLPAAADPEGMPNRIAALPAAGRGQGRVRSAVQAVRETWKSWMACVSGRVIKVPGIPGVSRSMAGLEVSDYAQQWEATHVALPEPTLQRAFAWV